MKIRLRLTCALLTALLLASSLILVARARSEKRLVIVTYKGFSELQQLGSQALQIINYQVGVLAAVCSDEQVAELRQAGFEVRVIDSAADPSLYYLAYPLPAADPQALSIALASFVYGRDVYIVKATPEQAHALSERGVDLLKLPDSIVVPGPQRRPNAVSAGWMYSPAVQSMVDAVSSTLLLHHVCKLQDRDSLSYCNELGTRYSYAAEGLNEAAQYLYDEYASLGLLVSYHPFTHAGTVMTNVVAELPGIGPGSDHIYILGAHYDSTSRDSDRFEIAPGADDNASGVAAVVEVARILSQYSFPHTLRFVNFAGEEQFLLGSSAYAKQARERGDLIEGMINLDMIAYESVPPNDHKVEIHAGANPSSIALADAFIHGVSEYGLNLVPQLIITAATWRSDHASFWSEGYPAILGMEDFEDLNPHYHSKHDTLANLQPHMMVEYTKASVATLAQLASRPPQDQTLDVLEIEGCVRLNTRDGPGLSGATVRWETFVSSAVFGETSTDAQGYYEFEPVAFSSAPILIRVTASREGYDVEPPEGHWLWYRGDHEHHQLDFLARLNTRTYLPIIAKHYP
jgi:Zn-dependent M28 family amino/carboxypeptidase